MRSRGLCLVVPLLLLATGCIYSRAVIGVAKGSPTEASANNYRIVKKHLTGEGSCSYLFGLFPMGDPAVATQAMDKLGKSAKASGESIGLINFTGDELIANYFGIVMTRSVSIRADAVEVTR